MLEPNLGPLARQNLLRAIQHLQRRETAAAVALCRQVLATHPGAPDALHVLGMALEQSGRRDEAITTVRQALDRRKDFPEAAADLANLLLARGDWAEAADIARKALRRAGDSVPLLNALGLALRRGAQFAEAAQILERAVKAQPKLREARHNLANVYRHLDRDREAEEVWLGLLAEHPDFAEALHDLGGLYKDQGRFAESERQFRAALAARPDYDSAAKSVGILLLSQGRLREAWPWYEKRRRAARPEPEWDGAPLAGRTLLVWGEQGIGDQVLFAGLLPRLAERVGRVRLGVEERLVPLFARSFPDLDIVPLADTKQADIHCPIGSLGLRVDLGPEQLPAARSYLKADPALTAELRRRYGPGPRIGLSWHSRNADFGHRKSMALDDLRPLLAIPGLSFVNLQYGADPAELAGLPILNDPAIDPLADLDAFAAQVAAMDLVVSVSNSTVHFAGALGVPCWMMLPAGSGLLWYWGHEGATSPWYPDLRIFRQHQASDWAGPIAAIAAELRQHFPG